MRRNFARQWLDVLSEKDHTDCVCNVLEEHLEYGKQYAKEFKTKSGTGKCGKKEMNGADRFTQGAESANAECSNYKVENLRHIQELQVQSPAIIFISITY